MPQSPQDTMKNAVDQIAIMLIAKGAARAQEMIDAAVKAKINGAANGAHNPVIKAATAALGLVEPEKKPRVRFLRRVDLGPIKEKLLKYIIAHPGQRSEEMMPHVRPDNVKPDAVLRALQQLSAEKWVTTEGVARGTKYTAATKAPKRALGSSKNLPNVLREAMKSRSAPSKKVEK